MYKDKIDSDPIYGMFYSAKYFSIFILIFTRKMFPLKLYE